MKYITINIIVLNVLRAYILHYLTQFLMRKDTHLVINFQIVL